MHSGDLNEFILPVLPVFAPFLVVFTWGHPCRRVIGKSKEADMHFPINPTGHKVFVLQNISSIIFQDTSSLHLMDF